MFLLGPVKPKIGKLGKHGSGLCLKFCPELIKNHFGEVKRFSLIEMDKKYFRKAKNL